MELVKPETVGFDGKRLGRVATLMNRYVSADKLPGFTTLIARHGKIVHLDAYGMMDRERGIPYQPDTIVRIFSMTKPIASVALMMLYEQSLFNLNDPIQEFIPELGETPVHTKDGLVPQANPMLIRHALTHTAGFSYGEFSADDTHPVDALLQKAELFNTDLYPSLDAVTKKLATIPLRFQPGTQWHYGMATDVVGRLVEVISGQSLADFIETNICQPLAMADTAFHIDPAKSERFATLYSVTDDDPTLKVEDDGRDSRWAAPANVHYGGSGMVSTVLDYYRFAQCLANGGELDGVQILGRKTLERMHTNHLLPTLLPINFEGDPPLHGMGFGLGFGVTMDIALTEKMGSNGDYGWGGYAETNFWIDPKEDLIGINMTQCIPSGYYPIRTEFRSAVYQALI